MIQTEENICPSCGAVIRPKAVFCHRCGKPLIDGDIVRETQNLSAVAPDIEIANEMKADGDTAAIAPPETGIIESETVIARPVIEPDYQPTAENVSAAVETPTTEAALVTTDQSGGNALAEAPPQPEKKRAKQRYVKQTEYVWEDASAPTFRILLLAVAAFGVVALLLWIGNFWK